MLAQTDPEELAAACGEDPSFVCHRVLDWTDSRTAAEFADLLLGKPLTIVVIILVAWLVTKLVRRAIGEFVESLTGQQPPSRRLKRRLRTTRIGERMPGVLDTGPVSLRSAARAETIGLVLRSVATFAVWTVALVTILGELGINLGPLIASAGIAGIALGFGAQSLVKDFLSGIFMLIEDQYGVGDYIDAGPDNGGVAAVEAVSLRSTKLRDLYGTVWHVPNGEIRRVANMSQQWARSLLDLDVAVGTDLDEAQRVIKGVADGLWRDRGWTGKVLEEPEIWGIEHFGPNGVTIRLVLKTRPAVQWEVSRELRRRMIVAFDEAGIEVGLPQSTVWMRRDEGSDVETAPDDPTTSTK